MKKVKISSTFATALSRSILIVLFTVCGIGIQAQRTPIALSFTAINGQTYIRPGIIKVINLNNGADTILLWPDTVLTLNQPSGIVSNQQPEDDFKIRQNYPNPATSYTLISLFVPEKDLVTIDLTDILGKDIIHFRQQLDRGLHTFRIMPGNGRIFFFSAVWRGMKQSVKILNASTLNGQSACLTYSGMERSFSELKTTIGDAAFPFAIGDELLFIGYTGSQQSGRIDVPTDDKLYTFQFATNIPCPGTPTVTYGGQVYNTIQIFSQCWLKENLNVGGMIPGAQNQSDNGLIEKYCYKDKPDSCAKYGALYQWNELMQYTTQESVQGICPPGWHLPSDNEWKILEGAVDSQFGIGNPEWDKEAAIRGYDAGLKLKSSYGWITNNGTDSFGFSCLPAGHRDELTNFVGVRISSIFGSSTWVANFGDMDTWARSLIGRKSYIGHGKNSLETGCSVRCLKDDE